MAELFAPLSHVAATHPHAALREAFTPEQLLAISDRNRLVAQPYRKLLVARDLVNQGAAVLVTSVGRAASLGVPQDRWVSLHGHCDTVERPLLERPDLGAYPAAVAAIGSALGLAGVGLDEVRHLDLYSCFPIAVSAVCDGLGLAADDPRGLTLTGDCPTSAGPATTTPCTPSPQPCAGCARPRRARPDDRERRCAVEVLGRRVGHRAAALAAGAVRSGAGRAGRGTSRAPAGPCGSRDVDDHPRP